MSAFTFWTVGPVGKLNRSCLNGVTCQSKSVQVSFFHTWVNCGITVLASFFVDNYIESICNLSITICQYWYLAFLQIIIPALFVALIQLLDYWIKAGSCCSCCLTNCYPIKIATQINIDDIDQLQEVEAAKYQEKINTRADPIILLSYNQNDFDSKK